MLDSFNVSSCVYLQLKEKHKKTRFSDKPITVVRSWPYSKYRLVKMPFVAFHYKLMCTTNHVQAVCWVELEQETKYQKIVGLSLSGNPGKWGSWISGNPG